MIRTKLLDLEEEFADVLAAGVGEPASVPASALSHSLNRLRDPGEDSVSGFQSAIDGHPGGPPGRGSAIG
ncbi:hypothetical protein [Pseudosporangium ferrugineum]|uniref:hypothetical protein n=1 Tax=Pseudosporangium ferrugineum TaxID=439699 RepID=UPI0011B2612A|nr:hypothetical protein [Pseudosporangium ferrugineum]